MVKFTVITQAYNCEKTIQRCVDSVMNQTYSDWEYVIIDNGSSDKTMSILHDYKNIDSRIRLFHNAQNEGYDWWILHIKELVEGDYFVSLDGDDWLDENFLLACDKKIEMTGADVVCVLSAYHFPNGEIERVMQFDRDEIIKRGDFLNNFSLFSSEEQIWAKAINKALALAADLSWVTRTRQYGASVGADANLWWEIVRKSKKIALLPEHLHHYVINKDISYYGYYQRDHKVCNALPILLEQERSVIEEMPGAKDQALGVIIDEYWNRISKCLDVLLNNKMDANTQIAQYSELVSLDGTSARKSIENELLRLCKGVRAIYVETTEGNFLLNVIKYLRRDSCNEIDGLQKNVFELEKDRRDKDTVISKREELINELNVVIEKKDRQIKEFKDAIAELLFARDSKDHQIAEYEKEVSELIRISSDKDLGIHKLEVEMRSVLKSMDEKDATLAEREQLIKELISVRNVKDAALAERERLIKELISISEMKDEAICDRDREIDGLSAVNTQQYQLIKKYEEIIFNKPWKCFFMKREKKNADN